MLKILSGLFLGLVVCIGSVCVTPTHASSAYPVVLTAVQAGSVASARDEIIILFNTTENPIDITGWCLENKSAVAFFCFKDSQELLGYILPSLSYALVVSTDYQAKFMPPAVFFNTYTVTNQSSGSITGSSESLKLNNSIGEHVDVLSWSSSFPAGRAWMRLLLSTQPDVYSVTGASDWGTGLLGQLPVDGVVEYVIQNQPEEPIEPEFPVEPPIEPTDPMDPELPENPGSGGGGSGVNPSETLPLAITELLANPDGSDTGKEFIELYNPNPLQSISLASYSIRVGPLLDKTYTLPAEVRVPPLGYVAITNTMVPFTLVNTKSAIQLYNGPNPIGEPINYAETKSGFSWAYREGSWQHSRPTPGAPNVIDPLTDGLVDTSDDTTSASSLKPCAANQYRSPETNRCRLISSTSGSTLTPCKDNQYRSEETNRCRTIATAAVLAACKDGQERNAETNRCRNIVAMTNPGQGRVGAEEKAEAINWYVWLGIAVGLLVVVLYIAWEWREELLRGWRSIKSTFVRKGR